MFKVNLGSYQVEIEKAFAKIKSEDIVARIWKKDHTVWSQDPTEISNRFGWLDSPEVMAKNISEINSFVEEVRAAGFKNALLLGMGGSSLAPEVFRLTFGVKESFLNLAVLDSTDPGSVLKLRERFNPEETLYIVSTKSGGTVETLSFFKYFYNYTGEKVGFDKAGDHFVAITDPGSGLEALAKERKFRKIFLNDPNIGGRFSALSYFGLAPAALVGVDLSKLVKNAADMAAQSKSGDLQENTSAHLGAILGILALLGRDKVTLFSSPGIKHFGAWAEQLIAESTGKDGMGILPVDLEAAGSPAQYRDDRLFIYLKLSGDTSCDDKITALQAAGHPTIEIELKNIYNLGGEFFRWEFATAVASMFLGINPYDQPNVESAKIMARSMVAEYHEKGELPAEKANLSEDNVETHFYSPLEASNLKEAITKFLAQGNTNDPPLPYVSIQAYVPTTDETDAALQKLRLAIRDILRYATTVGYGPRFLHSTGQLHKGDFGNGLFVQITCDMPDDASIPDNPGESASSMSFGVLKTSQALGDAKALVETGRKMIKFHIKGDVAAGIDKISNCLEL